ncbi:MAG TPA: glucose-1-phosphate thymidylyltransferase [Bacteroidetes bacterium]|nr:glucose-1-phosphate thymidylyltransferase [Bacteroidota bacterium]
MNYILFDDDRRTNLLPLVFTRPVADIRIGILTLREKWEWYLGEKTSTLTEKYLSKKFPLKKENDNLLINASVLPNTSLLKQVRQLKPGEKLVRDDIIIALRLDGDSLDSFPSLKDTHETETDVDFLTIKNTWDIFAKNDRALRDDFNLITRGRKSQPLSKTNFVKGNPENIFMEEGADVEYAFLNAETGPVYIGKNAVVMEGSKVRGPFAMCENAQLKLDAKIYGATTLGPYVKVGGEVNNTVFFGFSNKAHDGFLGNAVIGEWCNIGADTNNSNLKNTYDFVRMWSYSEKTFVQTNLQFCGMIMGDHSKTGINTMFNTGTVVGVSCNLYGPGFQRNFIPSFSWGSPLKMTSYKLAKVFDVATAVMKRRNIEFDAVEKEILTHLYNETIKLTI